ncbi:RICIN domain-containing protein [Bacillus sp. 103mf]|uniref:RICIN domain-containing protein n=1 Tax=unclassified Bacillus (in: firmicutes) TaxID=185979 RepID=UPI000B84E973
MKRRKHSMLLRKLKKVDKKLITCSLVTGFVFGLLAPTTSKSFVNAETVNKVNITQEQIKLDPSYQQAPFDGWGTALVWFANITGGWPDNMKNELADALYSENGLNFNIARYNIGGGNSPETTPYMRKGGAVPGYWNRPAEYGPPNGSTENWTEQKNWWNPENPEHWDWSADANQRWWLQAAKVRGADTFEAFSNSAPYFMTQSGYVSGNLNPWDDNLKSDQYENFANYLTTVVGHLQEDMNIKFKTLSPINEPNTGFWKSTNGQEGSNWSPASQTKIINEVKKQLDEKRLSTSVSAMDETSPSHFRNDWDQYDSVTRNNIGRLNVHTYNTANRTAVRDIAKGTGKPLWMSENDLGHGGDGQNFEDIRPGLVLSEKIQDDIQQLEPKAWVVWQAIEDEVNMDPQHENSNWGLIQVDFEPKDPSNVKINKNKKYYTMGNYSKFIRPGDQVINSNNKNTLAAIDSKNNSVVVVYTNSSSEEKSINVDLSGFESVKETSAATPYVTSAVDNLQKKEEIKIFDKTLSTVVQPQSVTTFVISDVSGVNKDNIFLNTQDKYTISSVNSGKVLDKGQDGKSIVQKTYDRDKESQQWSIQKVTNGYSTKEYYKIVDTASGNVLGVENGSAVEQKADESAANQKWMLSTYGNQEYTLINVQSGKLLDVGGGSKEEDAPVGVWQPNAGSNQVWKVVKAESVERTVLQNIALNPPGSGQEYPKASASFTGRNDKAANVNDGDISSVRWTNWDPNSWRPEDWVAIDFGHENTVSQLDFHFYDDLGGTRPPASLHLEYWDGKEWKVIEGTQSDVNMKKELTLHFAPIATSQIRAVMKAAQGTCIAISEIKVWG